MTTQFIVFTIIGIIVFILLYKVIINYLSNDSSQNKTDKDIKKQMKRKIDKHVLYAFGTLREKFRNDYPNITDSKYTELMNEVKQNYINNL